MTKEETEDFDDGWDTAVYGATFRSLDAKGEETVRRELGKGECGNPGSDHHNMVLQWLALQDSKRAEESLSISRRALQDSRLATRIAISAIVLTIVMAIKEIIVWLSS